MSLEYITRYVKWTYIAQHTKSRNSSNHTVRIQYLSTQTPFHLLTHSIAIIADRESSYQTPLIDKTNNPPARKLDLGSHTEQLYNPPTRYKPPPSRPKHEKGTGTEMAKSTVREKNTSRTSVFRDEGFGVYGPDPDRQPGTVSPHFRTETVEMQVPSFSPLS